MYICILLSLKKEWSNAICNYMDGPRKTFILSEIDRERQMLCYPLYVKSKKIKQRHVYNKMEMDSQIRRTN